MKLPWIARAEHDALMAEKDARIAEFQRSVERVEGWAIDWRAKYEDAIKPKAELLAPVPQVLAPREPSMVVQTIRELANGDQRMMQYLHQRKRELRKEHPTMTDDALCAELSKWETSENMVGTE